jgi:LysM repeat protein
VKLKFVHTIILIVICGVLSAQPDVVIQKIDGKEFYVHIVDKGHTIYSIAKLYQVVEEDVIESNSEASNGLTIGQTLYVPVNPEKRLTDEWHNPIRIEDGYLIHRVKRGETLFGISQEYKADVNQILEDNPEANPGIKKGMELSIRNNDVSESVAVEIQPERKDSLKTHKVRPGETLYSISKLYGVDISELQKLNEGFPEGLKADQHIYIPFVDELYVIQTQKTDFTLPITNTSTIEDGFNITLMVPLFLNVDDSLMGGAREKMLQDIGVQVYRGVLASLDSLKSRGFRANIKVIDVRDETTAKAAIMDKFVRESHLIIGPLLGGPLGIVSDFAESRGIHIVCPVPQKSKILLNHPNLSKVVGSEVSEMNALAEFVANRHFTDNVILVNTTYIKDTRATEVFRKRYNQLLRNYPSSAQTQIKEIKAADKSMGDIKSHLSHLMTNVIVMPSSNESLIQDILTKIGMTDEEDYHIVVYGTSGWQDIKIINPETRNRFNISYAAHNFPDYSDDNLKAFVKNYHYKFRTDPGTYALTAFDLMTYYGQGLLQFSVDFPNNFSQITTPYIFQSGFDYYQTGIESGFENKHFFILEHVDYELRIKQNFAPSFLER